MFSFFPGALTQDTRHGIGKRRTQDMDFRDAKFPEARAADFQGKWHLFPPPQFPPLREIGANLFFFLFSSLYMYIIRDQSCPLFNSISWC